MPTSRAWTFLILALVLYFLANQTQVGWVYVFTAGLLGLLLATFFYSRGMLKRLRVGRSVRNLSTSGATRPTVSDAEPGPDELDLALPTFHEDDPVEMTLRLTHTGFKPALLVNGAEFCPFAPAADQQQPFFIPALFKNQPLDLSYQTHCDRRGLYQFPDLPLQSSGPFGLFRAKRTLAAPGEILIYPAFQPLKRLRVLEQRGFSERHALRTGLSSDVIGTREYRSGDSLRQVHWRSTAHTGQIMVKELADTDQLTMTVVLDLARGSSIGHGKFSTFETAVRLAASFGYYATQKNIPFYLIGASPRRPPPRTALSWWAILNYLARAEQDGQESLAGILASLNPLPFVIVLVSLPDETIVRALGGLARQGTRALAMFITADGALPAVAASLQSPDLTVGAIRSQDWAEGLKNL
jgi:uncharacterized protein (DUF58 family)